MTIIPTSTEAIAEGQFKDEYFPNCSTSADVAIFIQARIDSATVRVKRQVGNYYDSTDEDVQQELHDCILYFACAKLWNSIVGVMLAYDEESLPPEFVDPEQAAKHRDYYEQEAMSILTRYDSSPNKGAFIGTFGIM